MQKLTSISESVQPMALKAFTDWQILLKNMDELHAVLFILCSPEKIGLGIELEINPINIEIKLCGSCVGHTDTQIQEIWILAQLESWGNHDEQPMV